MNNHSQIVTSFATVNGTLVPVVIDFDGSKLPQTKIVANGSRGGDRMNREFTQAMGDMGAHRYTPRACRITVNLTTAYSDFDAPKLNASGQLLAGAVCVALAARFGADN